MSANNAKTVVVSIEYDGTLCRVIPGEIDLAPDDEVTFRNQTEGAISLMFSEDILFPDARIKIEPGKEVGMIAQKVQRGMYTYAVYCECCQDFAVASSMPIIIIRK